MSTLTDLIFICGGIAVSLLFAFSDFFSRQGLTPAERIGRFVLLLIGCSMASSLIGWHFWPRGESIQLDGDVQLPAADPLVIDKPLAPVIAFRVISGTAVGKHLQPFGRVYIEDKDEPLAAVLDKYKAELSKRTWVESKTISAGTGIVIGDVPGAPLWTSDLESQLFGPHATKRLYIVGSMGFTDPAGKHEVQVCEILDANHQWTFCPEHIGQIDTD